MEKQLDAKTLDEATAWELHLAFLKRVGADVMTACRATTTIEAGVADGYVLVTRFAEDDEGRKIVDGDGDDREVRTYTEEYHFSRWMP